MSKILLSTTFNFESHSDLIKKLKQERKKSGKHEYYMCSPQTDKLKVYSQHDNNEVGPLEDYQIIRMESS